MTYCEWTKAASIKDAPTTANKCYEYLAARGFLLHRMEKEYMITNFRGGRCFSGNLTELKAHLSDTYYGDPR